MADWWDHKQRWKRRWSRWRRQLKERRAAWQRARDERQETRRMEESAPAPVAPAVVGRAVLTKFDPETVGAITAAIAEEIQKEVFDAALAEARGQLAQEFAQARERILDEAARFKAQAERDAEARIDQEVASQLAAEVQDVQDRLERVRGRVQAWRQRAETAEALAVECFTQLTGGVDQRPVYLYSGGAGLRQLDKGAVNDILARVGLALKSQGTASERRVVVRLADGAEREHTVFWLTTTPVEGVVEAPDGDEASAPQP